MPHRILDWNGLVELAKRPPAERVIAIAGVPARVKKTLATDAGIYVHSLAEDYADERWELKRREHMLLLRQLVDAGQVTIDDDVEDGHALARAWGRLLATDDGCFVAGCPAGPEDIDIHGPVWTRDGRLLKACFPHRAAIVSVIAQADPGRIPSEQ